MTEPKAAVTLPVDVEQIQRLLPHRYPFLLVDRVTAIDPGKTITAIKNVTINEPFFQGHFPGHPVMPGVLIVEAMAQTAGLLTQITSQVDGQSGSPLFYLVKVDNARFSAVVAPGDQLVMHVSLKRLIRGMGLFEAQATVDGKVVACCELMCAARSDK
ncbi:MULTISPECIES: 3-hydroxyacyl-ACP dehydratase FabZ [unclassified Luteibacter]|uniref:3-hydroxyacyl-ACP dehydratase FabZ n=1 Tax=unclassified Luteibacter TaxID=2620188 RepID=UPI0008B45108|nr:MULTISPECIES: 3-hydroxyacyl-ACP dehydratase FabZ [unclassified Luteibacter]MDR6936689.1 3-hydroxyacyl-[acyl-carrier-protein] dehydratase [Luteibacter sp. 3190]SEO67870.1 3-hydroxyacyl-[acyl-carrier-protein] dehydratase [Luteibacter sp. UNC138MFCol5.1]SEV83328.1 3-hydroxyacyl-[acyl-carrier-protein] dehydratase [Luteibacter sp. 329MFSha]